MPSSDQKEIRKGLLCMFAASICWSLGGLCIKFIPWNPMAITGIRAALAVAVFIIYRRSAKVSFTRGNVLAALCLSTTIILFVFANKLTTAAAAILLQFTAPAFIIVIELVLYRKKPKAGELAAVAVTILGMLLFFVERLEPGNMLGNLLAIVSGVSFAGVFVFNKRPDTNPEQAQLLGFYITAAVGLPFAFGSVTADPAAWGFMLLLGIVQVGLAYVFFSAGIKKTPALPACLITALEPVLNPIWVALVIGETPGIYALAGGLVILVTVVLYNVWVVKTAKRVESN